MVGKPKMAIAVKIRRLESQIKLLKLGKESIKRRRAAIRYLKKGKNMSWPKIKKKYHLCHM